MKKPSYGLAIFLIVSLACTVFQPVDNALPLTPSPSPLAIRFSTSVPPTETGTPTARPAYSATVFIPSPTAGSPPPTLTPEDTRTVLAEMFVDLATLLARTPTITATPIWGLRCDCLQKYTCEEFKRESHAQKCFNACGGTRKYNWSELDEKDRDGIVCEELP